MLLSRHGSLWSSLLRGVGRPVNGGGNAGTWRIPNPRPEPRTLNHEQSMRIAIEIHTILSDQIRSDSIGFDRIASDGSHDPDHRNPSYLQRVRLPLVLVAAKLIPSWGSHSEILVPTPNSLCLSLFHWLRISTLICNLWQLVIISTKLRW